MVLGDAAVGLCDPYESLAAQNVRRGTLALFMASDQAGAEGTPKRRRRSGMRQRCGRSDGHGATVAPSTCCPNGGLAAPSRTRALPTPSSRSQRRKPGNPSDVSFARLQKGRRGRARDLLMPLSITHVSCGKFLHSLSVIMLSSGNGNMATHVHRTLSRGFRCSSSIAQ